jgi:predicted glycogen debranching enzyme
MMLVNGFDAWVETPAGTFAITSQQYMPDVIHPDNGRSLESFETDPWPRWTFQLKDGTRIVQELFVPKGSPAAVLSWRLLDASNQATLLVRPFLSGRDYHALHHENGAFRFEPQINGPRLVWRPYEGVQEIVSWSNGEYSHQPCWYRGFLYEQERARGLDHEEDLAAPGILRWDLGQGEAVWVLAAGQSGAAALAHDKDAGASVHRIRRAERKRRDRFPSALHRAADAYLVRRGAGSTIVAGYPWFTDWGRDTFIALRGLCFAAGRLKEARNILLEWAGTVAEGMLPNRFSDHGEVPEYNAVDASLWFVIVVDEVKDALKRAGGKLLPRDGKILDEAVDAILNGYAAGTRFGVRANEDGLLAAGLPGVQLTWMDAKVGDWVVTPRIGKPVEIQALWLNALRTRSKASRAWADLFERGCVSFVQRFWNAQRGCLFDVVDCDHEPGKTDASLRPNQIFAVGGLPHALLNGEQARQVVEMVERHLLTPLGLRSLAPGEPGYAPRYAGGVHERDGSYHQGTVWPWLIGPFVEAWLRVHGKTPETIRRARERFLEPLRQHLASAGIGHVSEVADGDSPHHPGGCPFQAWSLAELLRLENVVLAVESSTTKTAAKRRERQVA